MWIRGGTDVSAGHQYKFCLVSKSLYDIFFAHFSKFRDFLFRVINIAIDP